MNRPLVLVTAAAALGLAACSSTPGSATTSVPAPPVPTKVVTETVTNQPAPPAKPVIGSFGYGDLKLGTPLQPALDTKLIGPALDQGQPGDACTLHDIAGTSQKAWVSKTLGVASISFSPEMSADGVGVGATEQKLKAEYTNLQAGGENYSFKADADGNQASQFLFGVLDGKVTTAIVALKNQDCHN